MSDHQAASLVLAFRRAAAVPQREAWPVAAQQAWAILYAAVQDNQAGLGVIAELATLRASLAEKEAFIRANVPHTADGVLVVECERLYCPRCGGEVDQNLSVCYCWDCTNPDGGNVAPLPLGYGMCLSQPKPKEDVTP